MKQPRRAVRTALARPKKSRAESFAAWLERKADEDALTDPVRVEEQPWNE